MGKELERKGLRGKELRVLGIDDSHFCPGDASCLLIGVLYRNNYIDGVFSTDISVDGEDATGKIAAMAKASRCRPDAIMLQGVTFAGFNVVDIPELSRLTNLPVIAILRKRPNLEEIGAALKNLSNSESKWKKIQSAGKIYKAEKIYYQAAGTGNAAQIIESATIRGNMPEPVRLAHVIASGIVLGSPHGRA